MILRILNAAPAPGRKIAVHTTHAPVPPRRRAPAALQGGRRRASAVPRSLTIGTSSSSASSLGAASLTFFEVDAGPPGRRLGLHPRKTGKSAAMDAVP